ncbi:hypothetical protein FACS1894163_13350 [Spirochaetia bacterium]|nr:hypothetical protein FACS1894163_13350 [Spirochaetia bacterium]
MVCFSHVRRYFFDAMKVSQKPGGAEAALSLFSLIETARANQLNPYQYPKTVFEKAADMDSDDDWSKLLPWNLIH